MDNKDNKIQIDLPENVAQGTYSNLAIIAHSSSEFVIDFIRIVPGLPKAEVKSRIILTPEHTKRLLYALSENLEKYENQYGTVNIDNNPKGFVNPLGDLIGEA